MKIRFENIAIMSDFDCTISQIDTNATIWDVGSPGWEGRFESWLTNRLPEKEHMRLQFKAMDLPYAEFIRLVDNFEIDKTFMAFAKFCNLNGIYLEIISSGTIFIIKRILGRYGLNIPVIANELNYIENEYIMKFPIECHPECPNLKIGRECATCRCQRLNYWISNNKDVFYIGDGESDITLIKYFLAHNLEQPRLIFAKARLAQFCQTHNVPFKLFNNFDDILKALKLMALGTSFDLSHKSMENLL